MNITRRIGWPRNIESFVPAALDRVGRSRSGAIIPALIFVDSGDAVVPEAEHDGEGHGGPDQRLHEGSAGRRATSVMASIL